MGPSGTLAGVGVRKAVEMLLAKRRRAGLAKGTFRESSRSLRRPEMCGVRLVRERLKFTGQAAWMISVVDFWRVVKFSGERPRVGCLGCLLLGQLVWRLGNCHC